LHQDPADHERAGDLRANLLAARFSSTANRCRGVGRIRFRPRSRCFPYTSPYEDITLERAERCCCRKCYSEGGIMPASLQPRRNRIRKQIGSQAINRREGVGRLPLFRCLAAGAPISHRLAPRLGPGGHKLDLGLACLGLAPPDPGSTRPETSGDHHAVQWCCNALHDANGEGRWPGQALAPKPRRCRGTALGGWGSATNSCLRKGIAFHNSEPGGPPRTSNSRSSTSMRYISRRLARHDGRRALGGHRNPRSRCGLRLFISRSRGAPTSLTFYGRREPAAGWNRAEEIRREGSARDGVQKRRRSAPCPTNSCRSIPASELVLSNPSTSTGARRRAVQNAW